MPGVCLHAFAAGGREVKSAHGYPRVCLHTFAQGGREVKSTHGYPRKD